MDLEHLFRLIRSEDVAIWVGAGFSSYAGYPNGKKLHEILYNELTDKEKKQININSSLRDVAGALVTFRNGSRNELNNILKREFSKSSDLTYLHDLLSHIPHFKDIITTNYDSLLEDSYYKRANVICRDSDVPYIKYNSVSIYKPHGDLGNIDKVVITKNDYANFHNIKRDTPFWISILDILSKKNLLFLGYGFEDENVWSWLDLIDNAIGNNRRERFLVAPDWSDLKVKELKSRSVEYINTSADSFLNELSQHLKLHIAADLENGLISQDTFNQYFSLHNFNSQVITEDGKPKLASLYKPNKEVLNTINIRISDKKIAEQFFKFNKGFGKSLEISNKHLALFEHFVDEFKMNISEETISSLKVIRPTKKHKIDIELPEDDLLIENIEFEIFRIDERKTKIEVEFFGFKVDILLNYSSKNKKGAMSATFTNPAQFPSVTSCTQFYKAIVSYASGKTVLFHWEQKTISKKPTDFKCDFKKLEGTLLFFENLRIIEKAFFIKFDGAKIDTSQTTVNLANALVKLIKDKYLELDCKNGLQILKNEESVDKSLKDFNVPDEIKSVFIRSGRNKTVELCGSSIDLGEVGIEIEDIQIVNFNHNMTTATIKSRNGRYLERYSSLFPFDSVKYID